MLDLDWKEIEILRAVSRGHDTAQAIRPFVDYSTSEAVLRRCKALAANGFLDTWKAMRRPDPGRPRWGSRAQQRFYKLTDFGTHVLAQHPIERQP